MKLPQLTHRDVFCLVLVCSLVPAIGRTPGEERPSGKKEKFTPGALGMEVPVITSAKQCDDYVGRLVAVHGVLSESKIPTIHGVAVGNPDELGGKEAYAVGILAKFNVEKVDPKTANDGPGVKYTLYFDLRGKLAEARPIPR